MILNSKTKWTFTLEARVHIIHSPDLLLISASARAKQWNFPKILRLLFIITMMIIILANDDEDKLVTPVTLSRKLINEAIIQGKLLNNVRAVIKMN